MSGLFPASLLVLSLSAVSAMAQVVPDDPGTGRTADDTAADTELVVTASRSILPVNALPLTVDVIDKQTLDQQVAITGSVTDAVAALTPAFSPTRQKLSGSGETLRGRSPLYAINGIPQTTPLRDGSRDGFTIDGFFVDRVELIYGSNALQGVGGTGGIVNQVTVGAPRQDGLSGRMLVQGTADNGFNGPGIGWKTGALLQYRGDAWDASVGAAYEDRGLFYDGHGDIIGVDLVQGDTMASKSLSFFGRFGYAVSPTARLDLILSRFKVDGDNDYVAVPGVRQAPNGPQRDIPTSAVRGIPPLEAAANLAQNASLSLTDSDLLGGNFVSQVFISFTRDRFGANVIPEPSQQDPKIAPVGTLFDQTANSSRKLGAKVSYERAVPGFEALTATIGMDALWDRTQQRFLATGRTYVPLTRFRSLAPFGQMNLKLFDGVVRLAGGARWENVEIAIDDYRTIAATTFVACSPRLPAGTVCGEASYGGVAVAGGKPRFDDVLLNAGVIVEPLDGVRVYGSYAEGFTVPDVGRITRSLNVPGIDIDTFLEFEPIVSNNRELGVEVKRGPLDASASYWWSSSDKGQLLVMGLDRTFDVQRLKIALQGLEVNLKVQTPLEGLRVGIGYAHVIGRFDSDANRNAPDGIVDTDLDGVNISPDRLNTSVSFDRGPISAFVQAQMFLRRSFHADLDKPQPDQRNNFGGYTVVDASVRYDIGFGALRLSAQNLLDEFYISYFSDTRFPTDATSIFAGRGRTFTLGWDYRF